VINGYLEGTMNYHIAPLNQSYDKTLSQNPSHSDLILAIQTNPDTNNPNYAL